MLVSKLNIFGWLHVAKQQRNIFFSVKYSLMSMTHKKRKISMMNDAILMQSISIVSRNSSCFEFFSPSCFIFIGKNITFVCTFVARQKIFMHLCISFAFNDKHARERNRNNFPCRQTVSLHIYILVTPFSFANITLSHRITSCIKHLKESLWIELMWVVLQLLSLHIFIERVSREITKIMKALRWIKHHLCIHRVWCQQDFSHNSARFYPHDTLDSIGI